MTSASAGLGYRRAFLARAWTTRAWAATLERRGYLLVGEWALQRSTRNILTHEYPDDPVRQALALTAAQQAVRQLVQWLQQIQKRTKTQP